MNNAHLRVIKINLFNSVPVKKSSVIILPRMKKQKSPKIFNFTWASVILLFQVSLSAAQGLTEEEKCSFEDLPLVPFATWKCEWRGPGGKCLPECEEGFTLRKANKVSFWVGKQLRFILVLTWCRSWGA